MNSTVKSNIRAGNLRIIILFITFVHLRILKNIIRIDNFIDQRNLARRSQFERKIQTELFI